MTALIRRVAVVTREGAAAEVRAFVGALSGISARVTTDLATVSLDDTDGLWLHDVSPPVPELLPWLRSGGRLLATLSAVDVPSTLGLESVPPDDVRDSLWETEPADPAPRGLAGFGPHPLFEGLQQGTCTWVPTPGAPYRWATYLAGRPAAAAVVAVERVGLELIPSRIVAWEYAVGDGGLLCIGSGIALDPASQPCAPQLRTLLGNALVGQGIPHRTRLTAAPHWTVPGQRVVRQDLASVPELPEITGAWHDATAAASNEAAGDATARWRRSGRRVSLLGGDGDGVREAWIHPWSIIREATASVRGPTAAVVAVATRWTAALEHPVIYWEAVATDAGTLLLEWTSDLRRSWPYPAGCGGDLELTVAPGGRRAALGAIGDPFRLIIDVEGGTLEAAPAEGPAVRFSLRGAGRCRVRFTGAADDADLERSREMLARRGLPGIRKQREDHERELATYATSIETPEPALVAAFERAKLSLDGGLVGTPGVGRCLAVESPGDRPGAVWYDGPDGCLGAMAQLAAGDRAAPRDTLKFLSLTQDVDGRIVEGCSTSGLASHRATPAAPLYLLLAARYAAWTGELDFLSRRWAAIRRAYELGMTLRPWEGDPDAAAPWAAAFESLQPLAEALGHPEIAEELAVAAGGARSASGSATFLTRPAALMEFDGGRFVEGLDAWRRLAAQPMTGGDLALPGAVARVAVEGLWGVVPNALESAVRFAPWFPPEWDAMAIERVRVGRTVLTVRLRRRFGQVAARVERVHGPRMHVEFSLRGSAVNPTVLVDDVELQGDRVAFEADGAHALVWHS